jgi:hypothetical protein
MSARITRRCGTAEGDQTSDRLDDRAHYPALPLCGDEKRSRRICGAAEGKQT